MESFVMQMHNKPQARAGFAIGRDRRTKKRIAVFLVTRKPA